jgi:hypothetical protein
MLFFYFVEALLTLRVVSARPGITNDKARSRWQSLYRSSFAGYAFGGSQVLPAHAMAMCLTDPRQPTRDTAVVLFGGALLQTRWRGRRDISAGADGELSRRKKEPRTGDGLWH